MNRLNRDKETKQPFNPKMSCFTISSAGIVVHVVCVCVCVKQTSPTNELLPCDCLHTYTVAAVRIVYSTARTQRIDHESVENGPYTIETHSKSTAEFMQINVPSHTAQ